MSNDAKLRYQEKYNGCIHSYAMINIVNSLRLTFKDFLYSLMVSTIILRLYRKVSRINILILGLLLASAVLHQKLNAQNNFSPKNRAFSATADYSSWIEQQIKDGKTSTADLIVDYHPRLWVHNFEDWDAYDQEGTLAWRIVHGSPMGPSDPANDQEKYEFCHVVGIADYETYGVTGYSTYGRRYLWTMVAAESRRRLNEWNFPSDLPGTSYNPDYGPYHTEDELLADARAKLVAAVEEGKYDYNNVGASGILYVSVCYDWLVNRNYSDGSPVLSESDRTELQNKIINVAEYMRDFAQGAGVFFDGADIAKYCYFVAGLALYEPSGQRISSQNNARAKLYLDEFDHFWIGKILPALNEQGGTGGWNAGLSMIGGEYYGNGSSNEVFLYRIAPFLFAHYTATGQTLDHSVFSTGALKYAIEFQNYMVYPNGDFAIGGDSGNRYQWIAPLSVTSRRRFSSDPEQQWLGELAGWVHNEIAPDQYVNAGSYDMFYQLMWEQKWPNPRSADVLECGSRYFAKLGWVAMRSGFSSLDDVAALFICQRYHWSPINPYAQNSFHIMRSGWLIEGTHNTIYIDDHYQRMISTFPTIADGIEAYSNDSEYDVGPGIQAYESNERYDYMFGDATNAYDENQLEKFFRQILYLKPDKFIIFDQVKTKNASLKKSWVIDPGGIPQAIGDTLILINNGSGALWIKKMLPQNVNQILSNEYLEVTPADTASEDFFLFILQATDSDISQFSPQLTADEAKLLVEDDKIGVLLDGWNILFNTTGSPGISINDEINDPPHFFNLPDITFPEDLLAIVDLNHFVFDLDHDDDVLNFTASIIDFALSSNENAAETTHDDMGDEYDRRILDMQDLQISIDSITHKATFTMTKDSSGVFRVCFTVSDPEGLTDKDTISVFVTPVNDPPLITGLPDSISFQEDSIAVLDIWAYVEDIETKDSLLTYLFKLKYIDLNITDSLIVNYEGTSGILTLSSTGFRGKSYLMITVEDESTAHAEDSVLIHVKDVPTYSDIEHKISQKYALHQNYPNPFNQETIIEYDIVYNCRVKVKIYDVTGKEIITLVDEDKIGGSYAVLWDATNTYHQQISSGLYFCSLDAFNNSAITFYRETKKMLLLR